MKLRTKGPIFQSKLVPLGKLARKLCYFKLDGLEEQVSPGTSGCRVIPVWRHSKPST